MEEIEKFLDDANEVGHISTPEQFDQDLDGLRQTADILLRIAIFNPTSANISRVDNICAKLYKLEMGIKDD